MNSHRVYNDDSQLALLFENREKLEQNLNEALADNEAALARMASLKGIAGYMDRFERDSTTEVRNKLRDDLEDKLNEPSLEEKTLLSRHPQGSRAYEDQQAKLDEIRRLMEQEQGRVADQTDTRRTKASEFVESEVINVTQAQRGLQAKFDQLRDDLQKVDSEISNYTKAPDRVRFTQARAQFGQAGVRAASPSLSPVPTESSYLCEVNHELSCPGH